MMTKAPVSRLVRLVLPGLLAALLTPVAFAQPADDPLLAPPNGPRRTDLELHALVGATVHPAPGERIELATVVIAGNRIIDVMVAPEESTEAPPAPDGARVYNAYGLHVYPGFIDAWVPIPVPDVNAADPGAHWNRSVMPQRNPVDSGGLPGGTAKALRSLGFTACAISPENGIFRGSGALVSTGDPSSGDDDPAPAIYNDRVYQALSFDGRGGYPGSQMGAIALIRQVLSDARRRQIRKGTGLEAPNDYNSLDALSRLNTGALVFEADNELEILRAARIGAEFGWFRVAVGTGTEFRRLDAIAEQDLPLIVPVNFPKAPDVASVGAADAASLRDLMTWEQAPTNLRRLREAGCIVSLTSSRLKNRSDFLKNLRSAITDGGLDPEDALAMLTLRPSELLTVHTQMGQVRNGYLANLVVSEGALFERVDGEWGKIRDVWVEGERYEISSDPVRAEFEGRWAVELSPAPPVAEGGEPAERLFIIDDKGSVTITEGDEKVKARNVRITGDGRISFVFTHDAFGEPGTVSASALLIAGPDGAEIRGAAQRAGGERFSFVARHQPETPKPEPDDAEDPDAGAEDDEEVEDDPGDFKPFVGRWVMVSLDVSDPVTDNTVLQVDGEGVVTLHNPREDGARFAEDVVFSTDDDGTPRLEFSVPLEETALFAFTEQDGRLEGTTKVGDSFWWAIAARKPGDEPIPAALPGYPFGAFALSELPPARDVVLKNCTLWTCADDKQGDDGIIENADVAIKDGKIVYAGPARDVWIATYTQIDCTGMHVTPGLIDCHSHTGIAGGVNEGGQTVTSEVRIGDVTDPDDPDWYRQLAGGLTCVNQLHGSANPIGGQSQTVKIRWGVADPSAMHFEGARPGIKFALGENVKRSNSSNTSRYPQTRMGVESIIRERFIAAREYAAGWDSWENNPRRLEQNRPRRDLELEALAEILAGERLIHCHSYRQDEILMLCRVAQDYGFTIGTFQHVLEGYKVAEAIREAAIGGSSFSDWWAYKFEVIDAIPYNGAIMHDVGVVVSFNSDSDELARRMNTEAAKAVKYGGLHPHEALKFVTLNPAKQLAIESRVGSIEEGKDADIAVWSADPLSTRSRCVRTFIDGREMFSLETDAELRELAASERRRLIQKLLADPASSRPRKVSETPGDPDGVAEDPAGIDSPQPSPPRRRGIIADARAYEAVRRREHYLEMVRWGLDPESHRCGECGAVLY